MKTKTQVLLFGTFVLGLLLFSVGMAHGLDFYGEDPPTEDPPPEEEQPPEEKPGDDDKDGVDDGVEDENKRDVSYIKKFRQIGNAVPVLLSFNMAKTIYNSFWGEN